MGDDEHALVAILQLHRVEQAAQPQDDVAPALAAGRSIIELADVGPALGLEREASGDARLRQAVEAAELLLAQALVGDVDQRPTSEVAALDDLRRGLQRPHIRRREDDPWPLVLRLGREPASERQRLALAQLRERHVDVALL